jgi:hypothetical protein
VLFGARHNRTLKDELRKSNSKGRSIAGSFVSRTKVAPFASSGGVSPLDALPIEAIRVDGSLSRAAEAGAAPQQRAREAMSSEARQSKPAGDSLGPEIMLEELAPTVDDLEGLAANLARECDRLLQMVRDLLTCGIVTAAAIAAQIEDARALALAAVDHAMQIVHATDFAVRKPRLVLHHVPSARPHRVDHRETLSPRMSAFLIKHQRLRAWTQIGSNLAWLLGATFCYILVFDVHSAAWMLVLVFTTLPIILMNSLAFNRELLKGITTTFQTVLACGHVVIMVGSFCALFRNQPFDLAASLVMTPSPLCAAFIGRVP